MGNAKVKLYSPSSQALLRFVFKFGIEVGPLPRNNCDSIFLPSKEIFQV